MTGTGPSTRGVGPSDATLEVYESRLREYLDHTPGQVAPAVDELLVELARRLVPGDRVLELGSGPGLDADRLEQLGLLVDRTDGAASFVSRLREHGHPARLLDARSPSYGGPYDAVLANAVLLHLGRADAQSALATCHATVRPGGLLALTLKEGDGEGWSQAKVGAPRWFTYWRDVPLRAALEDAGWEVVTLAHVAGRHEPWLHVLARQAAPDGARPGRSTTCISPPQGVRGSAQKGGSGPGSR